MKKEKRWRRLILAFLAIVLVYATYRAFMIQAPNVPEVPTSTVIKSPAPPQIQVPKEPVEGETSPKVIQEPTPEVEDFDEDPTLVATWTLRAIDAILRRVAQELDEGIYGPPGDLSYNIIFQFRQSLAAFRRLLENPFEGPDFRLSLKKDVLGQYLTGEQKILLGPETVDSEGVFLVVLFHEYQHHLLHTISGSPLRGDIVGQFYNEMSAHLFEDLLAAYLPPSYFRHRFRGSLPGRLKGLLAQERGKEAMALVLRYLLFLRTEDGRLFYVFLSPIEEGRISSSELIEAIHPDFVPDEERASALAEEAR